MERSNEEMEFESIEEFIEDTSMNLSVSRVDNNGLISWKLSHDSPLDDIVNPDGTHDLNIHSGLLLFSVVTVPSILSLAKEI
ncbi:unnamed protein product [Oikopleura dioica]|uniref:Uncharacterized protein n=1 Tax=Oikopleura dioica TaxID=34765 RepID=E4Z142_OIKDI|nr:unnamed protein product [Oikopleura dioica]